MCRKNARAKWYGKGPAKRQDRSKSLRSDQSTLSIHVSSSSSARSTGESNPILDGTARAFTSYAKWGMVSTCAESCRSLLRTNLPCQIAGVSVTRSVSGKRAAILPENIGPYCLSENIQKRSTKHPELSAAVASCLSQRVPSDDRGGTIGDPQPAPLSCANSAAEPPQPSPGSRDVGRLSGDIC